MNDQEKDLAVSDILNILWKGRALIVLLGVLCALFMFIRTSYFTDFQYLATGTLYVSDLSDERREEIRQQQIQSGKSTGTVVVNDNAGVSRSISIPYMEILRTRDFLDEVGSSLRQPLTWEEISPMFSVSAVNNTALLQVAVSSPNPDEAYAVAAAIIEKAPSKLESVFEGGQVKSVDSVRYPEQPIGKNVGRQTLLGLLAGAFLGVVAALILSFFDTRIRGGKSITERYNVSVLGEISQNPGTKPMGKSKALVDSGAYILNPNMSFDTIETYKSIRTNIMFSIPKTDKGKLIAITSSAPGEGKTTTAINLAITFAQTGAKVLLIDCDLRKARVHRYLGLDRRHGLTNVLCGFCDLETAIWENDQNTLSVITAGEIPPNPAELLASEEFTNILAKLQDEYDYIFIDTPPATVVTDATVIMKRCHGVVVVARENVTRYDLLDDTMETIARAEANVFGVVILGSTEKEKRYGYYRSGGHYGYKYGYKYGYRYGYQYGDGAEGESEGID